MFCKYCGSRLDDDSAFCGKCGKPIEDNPSKGEVPREPRSNNPKTEQGKKRSLLIVVAVILGIIAIFLGVIIGILVGDDDKEVANEQNLAGEEQLVEEDTTEEEPKAEYVDYEWAVEPTLDASEVFYVKENRYELDNNERKQMMQECVIADTNSGLLSVVDMDGNTLMSGIDSVDSYYNTIILNLQEARYDSELEMEFSQYGLTNGIIEPLWGLGGGMEGSSFYYYKGELVNVLDSFGPDAKTWETYLAEPYNPIPVLEFDYQPDLGQVNAFYDDTMRYGIYYDGQMLTDFEFEQCGSYSSGLCAAKKDGKWGYLDWDGQVVIPFEYDASWEHYSVYDDGYYQDKDYAYAATDGYVVLNRGGKWSLADTDGNIAIPEGEFDQICPVYEGKCWVQKDGRWGVIELD